MKQSQNQTVLDHLREHGSITALEAMERYGIMRLSGRIYDLRERGMDIDAERITVKNRRGEKVQVARYTLLAEEQIA